ncbi:MFS transporter [Bacillus sp. FJAT-27445]|uniref:MFS transporter n=1 Tax=Bacillus sp. FJAT-27445 TaxID=1679166 RepID=UPI003462354C
MKVNPSCFMIIVGIAGVAGLALLGFSSDMVMVWVSGILFGFSYGIVQPTIQAWALTLVPPEKKATANLMLLIFIDFGLAI